METAGSSESLISIYQNTRHHIPDNRNLENKHFIGMETELRLEHFWFLLIIPADPLGFVLELSVFKIFGHCALQATDNTVHDFVTQCKIAGYLTLLEVIQRNAKYGLLTFQNILRQISIMGYSHRGGCGVFYFLGYNAR
jgi:hypothetical protein